MQKPYLQTSLTPSCQCFLVRTWPTRILGTGSGLSFCDFVLLVQDPVIAIDLEWKPDRWQGSQNKVAMLQLASNNVALLIRTCNLGYKLMPVLDKFLR